MHTLLITLEVEGRSAAELLQLEQDLKSSNSVDVISSLVAAFISFDKLGVYSTDIIWDDETPLDIPLSDPT